MEKQEESKEKIGNVVITLKEGMSFRVGDAVVLVVQVGGPGIGRAARLRISAPKEVEIRRLKK
jgi:sRNA-binding carbon storage regulator CsrA